MESTPQQSSSAGKKKSNAWIWIIVVIVVVLVIMSVVGSLIAGYIAKNAGGKIAETILSKATNSAVSVNTDSGSVTVKGEDGTTTTFSTKLASGFPSDIPVYAGSTVRASAAGTTDSDNVGNYASLSTTDSMEKVQAFYDAELTANGWTKEDSITLGTIIPYIASKGDRKLAVTLTPYDKEGQVLISLVETKKK